MSNRIATRQDGIVIAIRALLGVTIPEELADRLLKCQEITPALVAEVEGLMNSTESESELDSWIDPLDRIRAAIIMVRSSSMANQQAGGEFTEVKVRVPIWVTEVIRDNVAEISGCVEDDEIDSVVSDLMGLALEDLARSRGPSDLDELSN
jgi:hypothetical protein